MRFRPRSSVRPVRSVPTAAFLGLPALALLLAAPGVGAQDGETLFTRSFDAGSGASVDIEVADADVIVESAAGSSIGVRVVVDARNAEDARELFESMDFEATLSGSSVLIRAEDPQMGRDWWRGGRWAGATVVVTAPSGSALDVRTSDGDIQIGDFSGPVALRSSDGDISAGRLSGARVDIHTSDGDIRIAHVADADISLRTSDGDVDVSASGGRVEAASSDGDVSLDLDRDTEVRVRTGDGDISIRAPQTLAADVLLDGEDLEVDGEFRLEGRIQADRVTGSMNGGGPVLEARTGDGTISLRIRPALVR